MCYVTYFVKIELGCVPIQHECICFVVFFHGNITDLYRKGLVHDNNTMDVIDDLDYQYMPYSNRLATVYDLSDRDEGFKDGLNAINNINDHLTTTTATRFQI